MAELIKITASTEVTSTSLASVLGVTARRIRQMTEDGVLETVGKGRYNLRDSVAQYMQYKATGGKTDEEKKVEQTLRNSEAILKASKAQIAKLHADEMRGMFHRSEDVEAVLNGLITAFISFASSLPGRVAIDCAAAETPAEVANIVKTETNIGLKEIAAWRYDPKVFADKVRERMRWTPAEDGDTDDESED